jgi:hypothetical protein
MLIGGLAVIARGIPRATIDIDAVIQAEGLDIDNLWKVLRDSGFEPRVADAARLTRERQVLLLQHPASGMPVDLSLGWLVFEREAMERATTVELGGVRLPVATPEDLIILKAVAWRDIDRADISGLLVRHHAQINIDRVRKKLAQFYEVLEIPERMADFDRLVLQVLGPR